MFSTQSLTSQSPNITHHQIPFKNVIMKHSEYDKVPILEIVDGNNKKKSPMIIDQYIPMLRYIGKLDGKLYPTHDPLLALQVDVIMNWVEDIVSHINTALGPTRRPKGGAFYNQVDDGSPSAWTTEEVAVLRQQMTMDDCTMSKPDGCGRKNIAYILHKLESHLSEVSTSSCIVGERVTIADLCVYQLVSWFTMEGGVLDGIVDTVEFGRSYPRLLDLKTTVESIEPIRDFRTMYGGSTAGGAKSNDFDYNPPRRNVVLSFA
jgi:glutathione S-transferase